MTTCHLGDIRLPDGSLYCPLQDQFVDVMPSDDARPWVSRRLSGREDILPHPLATGIGVFALQRIRQVDVPSASLPVPLMQLFDVVEMPL
jgi:hypothetical protein